MQISRAALTLIEQFEGNRLTSYNCPAGICTIGVGHTSAAGEPHVRPGMSITHEESMEILSRDISKFEAGVSRLLTHYATQHQFDALVALAFNIGLGAFGKSTLLRRFNEGDIQGAADQFLVWNKSNGKTLKGLARRREAERQLFLS